MQPDDSKPFVSPPEYNGTSFAMPKKKLILIGAAILFVGLVITLGVMSMSGKNKNEANAQEVALSSKVASVTIDSAGYVPVTVKVKRGQQVTWTNTQSQPRRLAADDATLPGFVTDEPLNTGDTYTYIFTDAGTFHYYDPDNPKAYVGTIVVE